MNNLVMTIEKITNTNKEIKSTNILHNSVKFKESQELQDFPDYLESQDSPNLLEFLESQGFPDPLNSQSFPDSPDSPDSLESQESQEQQSSPDSPDSLESQESQEQQSSPDSPDSLESQEQQSSPDSLESQDIDDDFENIVDIRCFNVKKIDHNSSNNKQINKPVSNKKVTFSETVQTKIVNNYIKDMDKILISKNNLISALNIIKQAIFRNTFRGNEIKIVVDFHNRLNDIINSLN